VNSGGGRETTIGKGIFYFHLIVVAQVLLLLGIIGTIVVMGTVLTTPLWLLLVMFVLSASGLVFVYRKIREQVRDLRHTVGQLNLAERNHEISILGGVFTMRVGDNPKKMLGSSSQGNSEQLDE